MNHLSLFQENYKVAEIVTPADKMEITKAMIAEISGIPMYEIKKAQHVGRVYVFDVVPARMKDPPIIVCTLADLGWYYQAWKDFYVHNHISDGAIAEFDERRQETLSMARLERAEYYFLRDELGIFKNRWMGGMR